MSDTEIFSQSSSDSESDDEEFLLTSTDETREAMIRRKLLESFYGSSDPDAVKSDGTNESIQDSSQSIQERKPKAKKENADLDSTHFNPSLYTSNLIHNCTTSHILNDTHKLSQSIRQLDSSMQTLVYENYSKFISATDAIRSIGQSVDVSNDGLEKLHEKMQVVEKNTQILETSLVDKRKQVVEKLKLKRLLNRLTRLVELPVTLQGMKDRGEYRFLMRDYLDAMKILTRHSENFESLKSIEAECTVIAKTMMQEAGMKIWVWCGGNNLGVGGRMKDRRRTKAGKSGVLDTFWIKGGMLRANGDKILEIVSPENVSEIYESAGAILMYANSQRGQLDDNEMDPENTSVEAVLGQVTEDECKAMALESINIYLETILENHAVEIQSNKSKDRVKNLSLYPPEFLGNLLEAASLYGITFRSPFVRHEKMSNDGNWEERDANLLKEYITMWFGLFLSHVKNVLLENTLEVSNDTDESKEEDDDEFFTAISNELMKLVRSVREVASGLALPEIGIDMDVASNLVEEATGITESMVKTRVMQKFRLLRVRVVKECLAPFVEGIAKNALKEAGLAKIIQTANVSLSDGLQYVDDTIRSILCNDSGGSMSSTSLDPHMIELSVRKNAREFGFWLASTLETIGGCEYTRDKITMDVKSSILPEEGNKNHEHKQVLHASSQDVENFEKEGIESLDLPHIKTLLEFVNETLDDKQQDALRLSLMEMSKVAQKVVSKNMNQSISSCMEESSKSKHEFLKGFKEEKDCTDSDGLLKLRFQLSLSRVTNIFCMVLGNDAVSMACQDITESCSVESEFFPHGPSDAATRILEVIKRVCVDCASAFGFDSMASEVPDFENDYRQDLNMVGHTSSVGGNVAMKGLSLDVARIFTQKIQVYNHHHDLIVFSRDAIVSLILTIAAKSWIEQIRQNSFSTFAYRQIQVDVEFLKYMLPHYLAEDSSESETLQKTLDEIVLSAGDRCIDVECVGVNEYYDEAMNKVMSPLSIALGWLKEEDAAGGRGALNQIVIRSDSRDISDEGTE